MTLPVTDGLVAAMGSTMVVVNEAGTGPPRSGSRSRPVLKPSRGEPDDGEQIALTLEVDAGKTILIDTAYGNLLCWLQASDGTQTNAMQYLSSDSTFWQLVPGENIVTFSTPSGSVEVAIEYASRYTGV